MAGHTFNPDQRWARTTDRSRLRPTVPLCWAARADHIDGPADGHAGDCCGSGYRRGLRPQRCDYSVDARSRVHMVFWDLWPWRDTAGPCFFQPAAGGAIVAAGLGTGSR